MKHKIKRYEDPKRLKNTKDFKKEYAEKDHAIFNMGAYDFERMHIVIMRITDHAYQVECNNLEHLRPYYASLKQLFNQLRPMMPKKRKKTMDKKFFRHRRAVAKIEQTLISHRNTSMGPIQRNMIKHCIMKMDQTFQYLLEFKQYKGMGIPYTTAAEAKKLIRGGVFGVAKHGSNLGTEV